jgi:Fe-S cluster assembly scaffold protein SufB
MMAEKIMINSLVPPTWNRLKVNETYTELPGSMASVQTFEGCDVTAADASYRKIETGCGAGLSEYLEKNGTLPMQVLTKPGELTLIKADYKESSADILCIEAAEGDTLNVLTDLTSDDEVNAAAVLQLLIKAGKNSVVNLTQVIRPGKGLQLINDIGTVIEENARVNLVQIFTDGSVINAGYRSELAGDDSSAECRIGLIRSMGESLDMNYVMKHLAPRSKSEINVSGALSGDAKKTFRGTIDFVRGCAGAEGAENESILILDDTVINKTVPLILCTEESVKGSHGASIGKPAEDMLYYMMSRGIDRETALGILERASLESAVSHIADPTAMEYVMNIINEENEDD